MSLNCQDCFSKSATPNQPKWTLEVQESGREKSGAGLSMSTGIMTLTTPNGETHHFSFVSGGFKSNYLNEKNEKITLQDSRLPGLNGTDLNGEEPGTASFEIDWSTLYSGRDFLPKSMKGPDGTGVWVKLNSDPDQTLRGSGKGDPKSFGIHTDGGYKGTKGCVGLTPEDAERFFSIVRDIPNAQKPDRVTVLPPTQDPALNQTLKTTTGYTM